MHVCDTHTKDHVLHFNVKDDGTGSIEYICRQCDSVVSAGIVVQEQVHQEIDYEHIGEEYWSEYNNE